MKNLELLGQQVDLLEKEEMKNIVGGNSEERIPCPPGTKALQCSLDGGGPGWICAVDADDAIRQVEDYYASIGVTVKCW